MIFYILMACTFFIVEENGNNDVGINEAEYIQDYNRIVGEASDDNDIIENFEYAANRTFLSMMNQQASLKAYSSFGSILEAVLLRRNMGLAEIEDFKEYFELNSLESIESIIRNFSSIFDEERASISREIIEKVRDIDLFYEGGRIKDICLSLSRESYNIEIALIQIESLGITSELINNYIADFFVNSNDEFDRLTRIVPVELLNTFKVIINSIDQINVEQALDEGKKSRLERFLGDENNLEVIRNYFMFIISDLVKKFILSESQEYSALSQEKYSKIAKLCLEYEIDGVITDEGIRRFVQRINSFSEQCPFFRDHILLKKMCCNNLELRRYIEHLNYSQLDAMSEIDLDQVLADKQSKFESSFSISLSLSLIDYLKVKRENISNALRLYERLDDAKKSNLKDILNITYTREEIIAFNREIESQ